MANPNPTPPPISGRWKPGQSGNPTGRPKKKPVTESLQRLFDMLGDAGVDEYNKEIFKKAATGDVAAWKELRDTLGEKPTDKSESVNVTRIVSGWDE